MNTHGATPPQTTLPIAWLLGLISSILDAYIIIYQVRVEAVENIAQRQIERSQAAMQKVQ